MAIEDLETMVRAELAYSVSPSSARCSNDRPELQALPAIPPGRAPIALTDRAAQPTPLPQYPNFNRPLADDALLDVLKHAAARLGYGLL